MSRFLPHILFLFVLILSGCTGAKTSTHGNGQGYGGIINLDNGRARCQFKKKNSDTFDVMCAAVAIDASGNEVAAVHAEEGVSLKWLTPEKIDGAEIKKQHCISEHSNLSQSCEITLASEEVTKIKFSLSITDAKFQKSAVASDDVLLPFSVQSFGFVPQLRTYMQPANWSFSQLLKDPFSFGFQSKGYGPHSFSTGPLSSVCFQGKRMFFSTNQTVYVLEDGVINLYAGSGNQANIDELSHRLRVSLGNTNTGLGYYGGSLACGEDRIYFSDTANHRIVILKDSGPVTVVADGSQTIMPLGLALAKDGSLYFADSVSQVVQKISLDGKLSVVAGKPGLTAPFDVSLSQDGTLYILDSGSMQVKKVDSSGNLQVVANLRNYTNFALSSGMSIDVSGNIYVVLSAHHTVIKIDTTGVMSTYAVGLLPERGIHVGPDGLVYIADTGNGAVRKVEANGAIVTVTGYRNADDASQTGEETPASIRLDIVTGLELDNDSLLFSAYGSSNIRSIDASGKNIHKVLEATRPSGLTKGPDGFLYWIESGSVIRKADSIGNISLVAETGSYTKYLAVGSDGTVYFTQADTVMKVSAGVVSQVLGMSLSDPKGIAVAIDGTVYVADSNNHRIISIFQGNVTAVAGNGEWGFSGDGEPATSAKLNYPEGIFLDKEGFIYIADRENARIRVFKPGQNIQTIIGGQSEKDCGGYIDQQVSLGSLENQIKTSLSNVCYGKPYEVKVVNNCSLDPKGKMIIAFSQRFPVFSNIVKVERPCPKP